jgi:hypothetical protein
METDLDRLPENIRMVSDRLALTVAIEWPARWPGRLAGSDKKWL